MSRFGSGIWLSSFQSQNVEIAPGGCATANKGIGLRLIVILNQQLDSTACNNFKPIGLSLTSCELELCEPRFAFDIAITTFHKHSDVRF